jgi:hypothetical protein
MHNIHSASSSPPLLHLYSTLGQGIATFLNYCQKKLVIRYRPGEAQRVGRVIPLLFHDMALEGGEWSSAHPGCTLPPGKTRYPFYRRLRGPQGWSGQAETRSRWDSIPDRPAHSQSLYQLSYPAYS